MPDVGARAITATNIPSICASMPNCAVPSTLAGVFSRRVDLPMMLKSLGDLSFGLTGVPRDQFITTATHKSALRITRSLLRCAANLGADRMGHPHTSSKMFEWLTRHVVLCFVLMTLSLVVFGLLLLDLVKLASANAGFLWRSG